LGYKVRTARLTLITQVIVQLAITVDLAAILPRFLEQLSLPLIFSGSSAERALAPGIKSARMSTKHPTHGTNAELHAMRLDERVPHFASLAKYAVIFLGCQAPR
jgi:hypothetical protein